MRAGNNQWASLKDFRKYLNYLYVISFLVLFSKEVVSQTAACEIKIDSNQVYRKAKLRGIYWTKDWFCPPKIKIDSLNCSLLYSSCKTRHTNRGKCKHTNGCTVWISAEMLVDARTGKVLWCKREKSLHHNYE